MEERATIEFYRVVEDDARLLASLVTDASPPQSGEMVNINRTDYKVLRVEYSVDQPSYGPKTLRRNVLMELVE